MGPIAPTSRRLIKVIEMSKFLDADRMAEGVAYAIRMKGGDEDISILDLYRNKEFIEYCEGLDSVRDYYESIDVNSITDKVLSILGTVRKIVEINFYVDDMAYKAFMIEYYRRSYDLGCKEVSELFERHDVFGMIDQFIGDRYGGEEPDNAIANISQCIKADLKYGRVPVPSDDAIHRNRAKPIIFDDKLRIKVNR